MSSECEVYDYVVVGGGTAGLAVAAGLNARTTASVCVVEEGPIVSQSLVLQDMRRWSELAGSDFDFNFAVEPEPGGNSLLRLAAGRILGGSSALNTSFAFHTPDADLRAWEAAGAVRWGPRFMDDQRVRIADLVRPEFAAPPNPAAVAFTDAAQEAGFRPALHGRNKLMEGVGWMPFSSRGTQRRSSFDLYRNQLVGGENAVTFMPETRVEKVIVDSNGCARTVELGNGGQVRAEHEVILCCGAISTPRLLMLSGVGPTAHLAELRIPTVLPSEEVGRNLADHPVAASMWRTSRPVGPSVVNGWEAGLLARSSELVEDPDTFLMFATFPFDDQTRQHGYPSPRPGISMAVFPMRPRSRGRVLLSSADPANPVRVRLGHFTDEGSYDIEVAKFGMELARDIAGKPALAPWIESEYTPGPGTNGESLENYVRQTSGSMYHPSGTCRMGRDLESVVTPELYVRGLNGLRIADASVFPSPISVTPSLTCLLVGEQCVNFILNERAAELQI